MNWIDRILGATRGELLALLRRSKYSIAEISDALGITTNAVRTHISAMQRDGMVQEAGLARAAGGKPARLYEITPAAEEMFPKAYAFVLSELLELLEEREDRDALVDLLREVGARASAGLGDPNDSEEVRVAAAAGVLRQLGGDVEVVDEGEAGWVIRGYGCPLSAVVAEHETVCALAESLVASVTGLPVTECCDRSGRPRCTFAVASAAAACDDR